MFMGEARRRSQSLYWGRGGDLSGKVAKAFHEKTVSDEGKPLLIHL